jgi:hypothetical protein
MTDITFKYNHQSTRRTCFYSCIENEVEIYFVGLKVHNHRMIMFDDGNPNRVLPLEVVAAFQTHLNTLLAEPATLGIIPIIPIVYSATIKSDGSFEIHEPVLN